MRLEGLEDRALLTASATIADSSLLEPDFGSTNMEFTVQLSQPSQGVTILNYFSSGGTATPDVDYDSNGGSIVFNDGESQQTISIPILGDPWDEPDEQFLVELFNPGAGTLMPIADINPGSAGSGPNEFIEFGGAIYFSADDGQHGVELWKYDGQNVSLVQDIYAGAESAFPGHFTIWNGALYFGARSAGFGGEIWRFDGTTATRVTDIANPSFVAHPRELVVYKNELYFGINSDSSGHNELWRLRADDTAARVFDLNPRGSDNPGLMMVYNDHLVFRATDGVNGFELWTYDGVSSPRMYEAAPDAFSSDAGQFTEVNGILYLVATGFVGDDFVGREVFQFDGTQLSLAADVRAGFDSSSPARFVAYNGALYFGARGRDDAQGNPIEEFWKFDGQALAMVMSEPPTMSGRGAYAVFNNELYFGTHDPDGGHSIWRFDGAHKIPVVDFDTGDPLQNFAFRTIGDRLYFRASDGFSGGEMWALVPDVILADGRATGSIIDDDPPVNFAPVTEDSSEATDEDTPLLAELAASDANGDPLTYVITQEPQHGTLDVADDGTYTYTPDENFYGADSFVFYAHDGMLSSDFSTVSIEIRPVNDAPIARNDNYVLSEDTLVDAEPPGVMQNDSDADGDPLSLVLETDPQHGSLEIFGDGFFRYIPDANYHGPDEFSYRVFDGRGESAVAKVLLTIASINDAPAAFDLAASTTEDEAVAGQVAGSDVDGDVLSFALAADPAHGSVVFETSGAFIYTPEANFHGTDSFTFTANDGLATSVPATVRITVSPVNDLPVAVDDAASGNEDVNLIIDVLANDQDADGDVLTPEIVSNPASGTLTINANGTITYYPATDFFGSDSFTYRVSDGTGLSNVATVDVTVNAQPESPVISVTPDDAAANTINLSAPEVAVAILSSDAFNAPAQVVVTSLRFGKTGSEASLIVHKKNGPKFELRDVNGDGRLDVVAYFKPSSTGLSVGDTQATLRGGLADGNTFEDSEAVTVTKPKGGGKGGGASRNSADLRALDSYFADLANDEEDSR